MYTFDVSKASALVSYELVCDAYRRIFAQLELPVVEGVLCWEMVGVCIHACMCVCMHVWHIRMCVHGIASTIPRWWCFQLVTCPNSVNTKFTTVGGRNRGRRGA